MIRVAIVEDQDRFRAALTTVFDLTPDVRAVAAFRSVEALETALLADPGSADRWDVVLMDLELPGRSGIEGLKILKRHRPDLAVVVCTVFEGSDTVRAAIRSGADGYLVKRTPTAELVRQIRQAASGGAPVAAEVAGALLALVRGEPEAAPHDAVRVAVDGSWIDSGGRRLDLRRRRAVRLLLAALAQHHLDAPGQALPFEACLDAGWPDERMLPEAARARLWTAAKALRDLGLADVLETLGDGYRLAADGRVRVVPSSEP